MTAEDLLTRTFAQVADATDYPTTPMTTVVARSRVVRGNRRRRVAFVAAAAVLVAGGLSAAVAMGGGGDHSPPGPAGPLGDLQQGAPPRVDYLEGDTFVMTSGGRITSPRFAKAAAAVAWKKGVLTASRPTSRHPLSTITFVSGGAPANLGCGTPSFAVPAGGADPVYWLSSQCDPDRGGRLVHGYTSTNTTKGAVLTPVGQVAGGTVADASSVHLRLPSHAVVVQPGNGRLIPLHLLRPQASSENANLVSGLARDASSYAVVDAITGDVRWQTPTWTLATFSTSGRYVAGAQGPRFGNSGVNAIAIFDAATGRPVMHREFASFILVGLPVWEGDDDVLVVAQDAKGREAILRIGLDGTVTRATPVVQDTQPPESGRPPPTLFRLASSP